MKSTTQPLSVASNIVSTLLHPLLMPTYGVILAFQTTFLMIYPLRFQLLYIIGVAFFTLVAPVLFIAILHRRGMVSDYEISVRSQRLYPYLFTILSYSLCLLFLHKTAFPSWGLLFFYGAAAAMAINIIINFNWKISAHLTGIGGLCGGVFALCGLLSLNPTLLFICLLFSAGLLASSRVYLKQHTPMQTIAGFLCGFICVFVAIWFI